MGKKAIHQMQRQERAQDDSWTRDFLKTAEVGYVATRWEQQPFLTPILFLYDPQAQAIYFHTHLSGRLRSNAASFPQACFCASRWGRLLPSNAALEFSIQYESVVAFGAVQVLEDEAERERALYALIEKYFPGLKPGEQYRPITPNELNRTAVYKFSIDSWSGKRNWPDLAEQISEWPPLPAELMK